MLDRPKLLVILVLVVPLRRLLDEDPHFGADAPPPRRRLGRLLDQAEGRQDGDHFERSFTRTLVRRTVPPPAPSCRPSASAASASGTMKRSRSSKKKSVSDERGTTETTPPSAADAKAAWFSGTTVPSAATRYKTAPEDQSSTQRVKESMTARRADPPEASRKRTW